MRWDYCDVPVCDRVSGRGYLGRTGYPVDFSQGAGIALKSEMWGVGPL